MFDLRGSTYIAQRYYKLKLTVIDVRLSNFCLLDADCLVVGESQGSSRRSAGKYPVKPSRPEGDSQTIDTYQCRSQEHLNFFFSNNRQFLLASPAGCEPARRRL